MNENISFKKWLIGKGRAQHTIRRYLTVEKEFISWYEKENQCVFKPNVVTSYELQKWKNALKDTEANNGKPFAPTTINNKIVCLKAYFQYLKDIELLQVNPAVDLATIKIQNRFPTPRWLEEDEKRLLFLYLEKDERFNKKGYRYVRNIAIIFFMLYAGLRVGEVVSLQLCDVENGTIYIRDGKGGKSRIIPMHNKLKKAYLEWLDYRDYLEVKHNYVFVSGKTLGPMTDVGIRHLFSKIEKQTRIKELSPHVLRHTFGHDLQKKGYGLTMIADLMGHSDVNTTRIYTAASQNEMISAINHLD